MSEDNHQARLEVLGPVRLTNGSLKPIKGRKRQALLAYLLEARIANRPEVSKIELIDVLYPEIEEVRALNSLRVEVHDIRSNLNPNVIETTSSGYKLGAITSDAEQFLEMRDTRLWRAAYLEGMGFEREDDTSYQHLIATLHKCALEIMPEQAPEAVRVMRLLVELEPYDLEFLRTKARALRATNNHRALGRAYEKARVRLREVGEHLPESWQVFLDGV